MLDFDIQSAQIAPMESSEPLHGASRVIERDAAHHQNRCAHAHPERVRDLLRGLFRNEGPACAVELHPEVPLEHAEQGHVFEGNIEQRATDVERQVRAGERPRHSVNLSNTLYFDDFGSFVESEIIRDALRCRNDAATGHTGVLVPLLALDVLEGSDERAAETCGRTTVREKGAPPLLAADDALVFELKQCLPNDRSRYVVGVA